MYVCMYVCMYVRIYIFIQSQQGTIMQLEPTGSKNISRQVYQKYKQLHYHLTKNYQQKTGCFDFNLSKVWAVSRASPELVNNQAAVVP